MVNTVLSYIIIVAGVIAIMLGIIEIKKKRLFLRIERRYDAETVKKFAPIDGAFCIIIGVGAIIIGLRGLDILPERIEWIGWIVTFFGVYEDFIQGKKRLKQIRFDHEEIF